MLITRRESIIKLLREMIRATKSDVFSDADFYNDDFGNCRYKDYIAIKLKQLNTILYDENSFKS